MDEGGAVNQIAQMLSLKDTRLSAIIILLLLFCIYSPTWGSQALANNTSYKISAVTQNVNKPALNDIYFVNYTGCGGINIPVVNTAYEQQVFDLTNQQRAQSGLPPFKLSNNLAEAARTHAADMAQDGYFLHDSYDLTDGSLVFVCSTWDRIRSYYSPATWMAENIAAGYPSPVEVVNGWMTSPGHRQNILSPDTWELGVGYYQGGSYGSYWVQDFGRRQGVYPLVINQDEASTDIRWVSLYIYGSWSEVRLRNDDDDWEDWIPFQNNLSWELGSGAGNHTVWAEMRTDNTSASSSDSIFLTVDDGPLDGTPTPTLTQTPIDNATPTTTRTPVVYRDFMFLPQVMRSNP